MDLFYVYKIVDVSRNSGLEIINFNLAVILLDHPGVNLSA
jgi:hypothetical protein